jgi:hypothetical protein
LASSLPLPGIEYQSEVATSRPVFLRAAPTITLYWLAGSDFLVRRSNLFSPSVT